MVNKPCAGVRELAVRAVFFQRAIKLMLVPGRNAAGGLIMGRFFTALALGLVIAAAPASPVFAQGAKTSAQLKLAKQAEALKPGEWVWAPQIAPSGPIL